MGEEQETRPGQDPLALPPPSPRMKAFSLAVFFLFGFALGAFVFWNPFSVSWLPGGGGEHVHEQMEGQSSEEAHTQLLTCPMHPEVVEEEPVPCPICNMKLVPLSREDEKSQPRISEKETAKLWTCPMHPEVVEKEPVPCPICHMKLVPLSREDQESGPKVSEEQAARLWTCPMHPEVIEREPGLCPVCHMKLVEMDRQEGVGKEEGTVKIDPEIVQKIGVRTEHVRVGELRSAIRTLGILDYNEKNIFLVNTKFDGWIEKVHVNYIGEKVRKGQKLFEVYSPELVSTQEEYLSAVSYLERMKAAGNREAIERARALKEATGKRLAYWDVTEAQIRRLEESGEVQKRLTIVSPASGVVVEKMSAALEGMYAKAGMNLYKIADLSSVWVHADVYESERARVRPGLEAEVVLPFLPGKTFTGEVLFLQPFLTEKTRTVKACIEIKNEGGRLEPGMYAQVKIKPAAPGKVVLVPEDAVIRTGERSLVFLDLGEGRFLPREVELGRKGEREYEVRSGLAGDEKVVVSAQFLLDSESRLQEFLRKLTTQPREDE